MKSITIRELHARTGRWVRQAARYGEILVTDNGKRVARLIPDNAEPETPYFARRKVSARFRALDAAGKLAGGTDSTAGISEDREDRL